MNIKTILGNEKGTTVVIVTILLTFILGITAFVIDIGIIYAEKQRFQNALDAAALASAQELPDVYDTIHVANSYIEYNGYSSNDITITFSDDNATVNIDGTKTVGLLFAKVLGINEATITPVASATNESGNGSVAFDYAVFSGSTYKELIFDSKDIYINGNVHTNDTFKANGEDIDINGRCEAVDNIEIDGKRIDIPDQYENYDYIEMPDFSDLVKEQAKAAGTYYYGDKTFNASNLNLDNPIYVKGKVTINGSDFNGTGCIVAEDEIIVNGENASITPEDAVCLYSKSDKIVVNNENATITGILYAPNGEIILNGKYQQISGRVVGKEVRLNGEEQSVSAGSSIILNALPFDNIVKLVR